MCVKLHVEQAQRSKNVQDSERDFYIRVPRGTEKHQRKKWRTQENLASSQSWITSEGGKVWSKHHLLLIRRKGQIDDKRSTSLEASPATRAKIPCLWMIRCKRSLCDYRHPPVCRNYKSANKCIHGYSGLYRHADGAEKPSKRSKSESTQGAVANMKEKQGPRLCISKFRFKEVYPAENWTNEMEVLHVRFRPLSSQSILRKNWHPSLRYHICMHLSHHIHVFFIEIRKCFTIWSASILVLHDVGKWNRFSWTRNVVLSFPLCRLLRYHHQHLFSGSCPPLEVMVQVGKEVSLLRLNHVFQWDRECFMIWFVNIQSRFFTMSVDEISTHGSRIFDVTFFVTFFDSVHTRSVSHAHFLCTFSLRDVQTRTCMTQGVSSAHVTSHPLHSHVSSVVLLPVPARSLRHLIPSYFFLAELFPIRKRGSSAIPHERRKLWPPDRSHALHKLMSPKRVTRSFLWTMTRRPSTIRTTIISPTSPKSHSIVLNSKVIPQCLKPLFRTFLMVSLLFRVEEVQESTHREIVAGQRERGKRRFCDQCCRVDVKGKSTEQS